MTVYIGQGIGIIGLLFAVISFQKNSSKGILLFQILASTTFILHFLLIGAYTGSALNFIGVVRNLLFYYIGSRRRNKSENHANKKLWLYLFIVIYIIAGSLTYKNFYSIFPIVGTIFSTVSLWIKNPKYIRLVMLPSSPCWMIYNFVNMSIAGVMTELFVMSSLIVAMLRFDLFQAPKGKSSCGIQ